MTDILSGLDEWSFDGVSFLAREAPTTEGRKTVTHEFVNSTRREVEDLGPLLGVFRLQAIISNRDGQYFQKRDALRAVLKKGPNPDGSPKILSHAFLGKFEVVAKPFTLVERINDLGAAFFDLTFEQAVSAIAPLPEAFTVANVQQAREDTMNALAAEFEKTPPDGFRVSQAFPFNFTAATNLLNSIGNSIESVTRTFNRALAEIDNFAATLNDFRNNIRRLINLPGQLTTSLTNLYDSVVALSETPSEATLTLEKLFDFGSDLPIIEEITAERIERKQNQDLLTGFMQIGALAYAYEQVANIPFFTIREIDSFSDKLNTQFNSVFPAVTDANVRTTLQNLNNVTNEFLDIQRLNVKKIVEIETTTKPAQVLAYEFYGSVNNYERLVSLNSFKDVDFISGDVEVFR
jgi:prophage DNA circulation protein